MLITIHEAAEATGKSREYIRGLCQSGRVAAMKNSHEGRWYLNLLSLQALLEEKQAGR